MRRCGSTGWNVRCNFIAADRVLDSKRRGSDAVRASNSSRCPSNGEHAVDVPFFGRVRRFLDDDALLFLHSTRVHVAH